MEAAAAAVLGPGRVAMVMAEAEGAERCSEVASDGVEVGVVVTAGA